MQVPGEERVLHRFDSCFPDFEVVYPVAYAVYAQPLWVNRVDESKQKNVCVIERL